MTTAPASPNPSRTPWIIAGVLGCLVLCLLVVVAAGGAYFFLSPGGVVTPVGRAVPVTAQPLPFPSETAPAVAPTEPQPPTSKPPSQSTAVPIATEPSATSSPAAASSPAAPTGKIAFSVMRGDRPEDKYIWIMNADGTGAKQILDRASSPAFSPDGKRIAYFHWSDGIYVANADGTNGKKVVGDTFTRYLDWSHDGRLIAFTAQPGATGNVVIDVAPPDASAIKDPGQRRNAAIGISPSWSPDDTLLIFATCQPNCGIYKGSAGGGGAVPIVTDDGGLPAWSPDGKKIVYQKEVEGQKQLFVINPDGSGKVQITRGSVMHVAAQWSPDGNYIFYRSPEGGSWSIWRMNADGSNPAKIRNDAPPVDWAYERLAVTR